MPTTSYSNWDFYNYHVQQELTGGQFVSAESTLVAAGPPLAEQAGDTTSATGTVYPIGLLESFSIQQSKQLQRVFEIGSSRSYFIGGRVIGSFTLGRTFFFGPSLMRVLYAYYNQDADVKFGTKPAGTTKVIDNITVPDPMAKLIATPAGAGLHNVRRNPGEDYFFIELGSDLFNQPHGIAIYFKDANFVSVGAMYLESCYIQGHQMSVSSGSVLVMEGVSAQYDRIVPIKVMV